MHLSLCRFDTESAQILEILNEAILNSTALYDYKARSIESMAQWFKDKELAGYPVIGAFENEKLLGFASYGAFRNWPAYKYTVEHSVYIYREHRGKGLSVLLMQALIDEARKQQYHVMVGAIDASNQISIALHQKLGFDYSGTIRQAGFKFGRWLDLALYQLILETPSAPTDG